MAHATQILTSHRIQKQQAIVDIDAFGPPKQLGIKPTKNGFYLKHGWDTQTKMLGYAERNGFFGRKDFDSKWIPEKIHQCIGSVPSSVFLQSGDAC